ncbi:MAG TPA: DUF599 domain-containing protein [Burkholderiaceae bacterium]|nr:DUF599 domain-containing protein [Rhodoferax sp.]MBK7546776.1 DUF599 domain-containing protein [Rhodoferax sp.]MBP7575013.1 DUF599 domain-containing protein [Rhodoferax sp.]HPW08672.1 DUF599 domain-containing protein [Burkholderiaceae bacterium]
MKVLSLLPWADWLALFSFIAAWMGYAWFATVWGFRRPSLLASTNRYRRFWMLQSTARDPRVLDGIIVQSLSTSPSFFASTSIIITGGLFALMGTTDKAAELVREIPFAQQTPILVFELKVLVLVAIFVYAFFRFSWSMRQYTFASLVIGSMPDPEDFATGKFDREQFANRASAMLGLAAETFNSGLRAYYFSFAAMAWFFSPLAFLMATFLVVAILYSREFRSDVLQVLND